MTADQTPSVADVIDRHEYDVNLATGVPRPACACGWVVEGDWESPSVHSEHVAEQVESLIAAREQAVWDRLCDWLDDHVDSDVRGSVKTAARMTNPYRIEGGKP